MKHEPTNKQINRVRGFTIFGFWILGVCTNFSYVVIISAAYDLLDISNNSTLPNKSTVCSNDTRGRECNEVGTGVILFAGILPTLILKMTLPWCLDYISYHLRVAFCVLSNIISLIILGTASDLPLILTGVVFASIEAGLGEITFLSLCTFYGPTAVVAWSSGTGASGIIASVYYLLFSSFIPPRTVIYFVLAVPCVMAVTFWGCLYMPQILLLKLPNSEIYRRSRLNRSESEDQLLHHDDTTEQIDDTNSVAMTSSTNIPVKTDEIEQATSPKHRPEFIQFLIRFLFIRKLIRYMLPLFIVYLFEYMINQGLYELLYYNNTCFNQNVQYRLYQMLYQLGVFVSRSSTSLFRVRFLWAMSFLQVCNFVLLYCEAVFQFIPFILITCIVVLFEGLLGGGTYANAFYRVNNEIDKSRVEFSMGVVSVADSFGITLAAILSIFIHNGICNCH
ncbi:Battenin [Oopsacas minuta]|uniref:Battenin n=1 Tax=Oopsacas minuta TaxID=111878 RepID=A0AAV7KIE2_9METZ|nr:Battenin [Oopsacas minuta]